MKLPSQAKRVFKGEIFDVYQWQQEMFDGSHQTFEMLKRPATVEVIATKANKIFISHQSQPTKHDFYSLFGGRVESDEEPGEAAKRELLEESGLKSDDWELLKVYEPVHKIDWQIYLYIARNCEKVGEQNLDVGEKIEVIEVSFDEFITLATSDTYWGAEFMVDILKMQQEGKIEDFKKKIFGK